MSSIIDDSTSLEKIIQVFDSSGAQQVVKGNGYISGGGHFWGEGEVRNGYRVGVWRSCYSDGTPFLEELYEEGKLVAGFRAAATSYQHQPATVI